MRKDEGRGYGARLRRSLGLPCLLALPAAGSGSIERALSAALQLLEGLAPGSSLPGQELLGERAEAYGFGASSRVSSGGATRFVRCADGDVALALARHEDVDLVPALVQDACGNGDAWSAIERWASDVPAVHVRDRAVLLGLACSVPGETSADLPWVITDRPHAAARRPRVLDLSSLWAGPLCSWILGTLGCEVLKLEDPARRDGARQNPAWFSRLYPDTEFGNLRDLGNLLPSADVVIEASRPRALRQRGFRAEDFPGVWVSITGYGRDQPGRIGYGDDAAVAGGLVGPGPSFVGDAVADPLTGVHAALAAWALLSTGRGGLVDIALSRTAAAATTA